MSDESDRFRKRARECRERAAEERDESMRRRLTRLSIDLEDEADEIELEDAAKSKDA